MSIIKSESLPQVEATTAAATTTTKQAPKGKQQVKPKAKFYRLDSPATSGHHLRANWIAGMMLAGAWNGACKAAKAFHWAQGGTKSFYYHKDEKGNIFEVIKDGKVAGYRLGEDNKHLGAVQKKLLAGTKQELIDGYLHMFKTGELLPKFTPKAKAGCAVKIVSI